MRKRQVLIVEDDLASGSALRTILSRLGMDVTVVTTVAQGLVKLDALHPDYVVLDLMLPDGDGEQILRHIRSSAEKIRVCVTTASNDVDRLTNLQTMHPDCVLPKPIDLHKLLAQLEN